MVYNQLLTKTPHLLLSLFSFDFKLVRSSPSLKFIAKANQVPFLLEIGIFVQFLLFLFHNP